MENMFYGASPLIFHRAEDLRKNMTSAERIIWKHVHINEWKLKFRRQHPISHYVVDFYCHQLKLVVEIDGGIHEEEDVKRKDEEREKALRSLGLRVIRFKNEEVYKNSKSVLEKINSVISELQSSPLGDRGKLFVIKIGGNIIDDEEKLASFLTDFARIDAPKILVHGGGKLATKMAAQLNIPQQMVEGRRITDSETLKIVTMVYAGLINKNIVAQLQAAGCNAIGLSGADGNAILAHKRFVGDRDYGYAGDIDAVNGNLLQALLQQGLSPVLAPITHDQKGQLLNTNADTIAQETAKTLSSLYEVHLVYSFEKSGVLLNAEDEATVIPVINPEKYRNLKEKGLVFAGMIPKLDNAFSAVQSGVRKVLIGKAENINELISGNAGTSIVSD
ncbi:acetylglutamate kinase [Flavisolibacter nicotianae]|uniref:acetylglutamate kinase n=1 Tax=Flavisolibacter nicotianae TaxID=2364882 RepID=UPI000EACDBA3|nr:acetylglutamate kinase [Flavisolibacter nicotianae]